MEYALASNWSIKAEYNFIDFGQQFEVMPGTVSSSPGASLIAINEVRQTLQLVKVGVNYHFHAQPAVIAARY